MAKRNKQSARQTTRAAREKTTAPRDATLERAALVAHPPAKNPSLLAVSILLFVGWFIFLLVTALVG